MIRVFNYPFSIFQNEELERQTIYHLTEFLRLFPIIIGEEEIKIIQQIENEFDDENDKRKFTKAYYKATIYAQRSFLQCFHLSMLFDYELSFLFEENKYDESQIFKLLKEFLHKSELFYFINDDDNKLDIESFKKYICGYLPK